MASTTRIREFQKFLEYMKPTEKAVSTYAKYILRKEKVPEYIESEYRDEIERRRQLERLREQTAQEFVERLRRFEMKQTPPQFYSPEINLTKENIDEIRKWYRKVTKGQTIADYLGVNNAERS